MISFNIFRLIHLLLYFLIAVQLCFYLYVMSDALRQISINSFLEQRRIVYPMVTARLSWIYYATLLLSFIMLIWSFRQGSLLASWSFALAAICIVADVIIAVKYNGPINQLVQEQSLTNHDINWRLIRENWLWFINLRAVIVVAGITGLFTALVFRK